MLLGLLLLLLRLLLLLLLPLHWLQVLIHPFLTTVLECSGWLVRYFLAPASYCFLFHSNHSIYPSSFLFCSVPSQRRRRLLLRSVVVVIHSIGRSSSIMSATATTTKLLLVGRRRFLLRQHFPLPTAGSHRAIFSVAHHHHHHHHHRAGGTTLVGRQTTRPLPQQQQQQQPLPPFLLQNDATLVGRRRQRQRQRWFFGSSSSLVNGGSTNTTEHDDDSPPGTTTANDVASAPWDRLTETSRQLADQILRVDDNNNNNNKSNHATASPWWVRRTALSKAITLAESRAWHQQEQAGYLLTHLLQNPVARHRRQTSFRLGIAGAPGAGKSTFIEALGKYLLDQKPDAVPHTAVTTGAEPPSHFTSATSPEKEASAAATEIPPPRPSSTGVLPGNPSQSEYNDNEPVSRVWVPHRVAVVCVDPTSARSGGSILGDKTRMPILSAGGSTDHPNSDKYGPRSYVRPAPSGSGNMGGLSTYTHDVVTLCQVANYDLVIVETVGVGQSEVEVEQVVDMLLLLVPPAGGDDLQGVKKGIVEVADLLVVTKADGHLQPAARQTATDYKRAMPFVHGFTPNNNYSTPPGWEQPPVLLVSSATGDGLDEVWKHVSDYRHQLLTLGILDQKRQYQDNYWMWKHLQHLVQWQLMHHPHSQLQHQATTLQNQLRQGRMTPRVAASQLLDLVWHNPPSSPATPTPPTPTPPTLQPPTPSST